LKKLISALSFVFLAVPATAETFNACRSSTFTLPELQTVDVVADSASTATLRQLSENPGGGADLNSWSISASATQSVGPFPDPQRFAVSCVGSGVTYEFFPFDPSLYALLSEPAQSFTSTTSVLFTTPKLSVSGVIERKVTNVTVADDGAGTKPTGAIPITTDFATCTCNDATGCTMSIAEPTVTSGYGRSLSIVSVGTGNCEFADSSGVTEIGSAIVLEPTSVVVYVYANAAWHAASVKDNVP
jgi:hypothetical protein